MRAALSDPRALQAPPGETGPDWYPEGVPPNRRGDPLVDVHAVAGDATISVFNSPWGPSEISTRDIALLARALGQTYDECAQSLNHYDLGHFADEWRRDNPQTDDEIREFYGNTVLYLRELLLWNGCADYQVILETVRLAAGRTQREGRRALDHGSGVGTVALEQLRCGYATTIADVPGPTYEFARHRIASRGLQVGLFPIDVEIPDFGIDQFDLITSFDVLEHVSRPAEVTARLVAALRPRGVLAITASFDWQTPDYPHHLPAGAVRFGGHRWSLYLRSLGLRSIEGGAYQRAGRLSALARRAQYELWRRTGVILLQRVPR